MPTGAAGSCRTVFGALEVDGTALPVGGVAAGSRTCAETVPGGAPSPAAPRLAVVPQVAPLVTGRFVPWQRKAGRAGGCGPRPGRETATASRARGAAGVIAGAVRAIADGEWTGDEAFRGTAGADAVAASGPYAGEIRVSHIVPRRRRDVAHDAAADRTPPKVATRFRPGAALRLLACTRWSRWPKPFVIPGLPRELRRPLTVPHRWVALAPG